MKKSKIGVTHLISGKDSWEIGFSGFFLRARGMTSTLLMGIILSTGVPFWWQYIDPNFLTTPVSEILVLGLLFFTFFIVLVLFHIRKERQRSLSMYFKLHSLVHDARDVLCSLMERTEDADTAPSSKLNDNETKHLKDASNQLCESIASYFRDLVGDQTVGCAIRVGIMCDQTDNSEMYYETIGRSDNMNRSREATTTPIPRSQGIPKFFESEERFNQGVLFYDNIELASNNGAYFKTKNDEQYKDEICSMAVIAINGWNGNRKDLIGLLYITSKTTKIMNSRYVDVMKFSADLIASIYTCIFSRLKTVDNMPDLSKKSKK